MSTNFDKIVRSWMNNEKMSGYIKKNALSEELLNLAIAGKDKVQISSVINMIEGLPAADVAPVVHAYWRGIEGDGYDPEGNIVWDTFECTNCGEEHYADGEPTWDYCPFCGARMDGEEENLY